MIKVELSQIALCSPLVSWAFARYVVFPSGKRPYLNDNGEVARNGKLVTLPSYTEYLGEYEWWITQEIRNGSPTRAKAQHKRSGKRVYSHEATTVRDAVYLCMIDARRRSGSFVDIPDKYAVKWLKWRVE